MTITAVRSRLVYAPRSASRPTPVADLRDRAYVVVEVMSSSGACGVGYVWAFGPAADATHVLVTRLADALVGCDALDIEPITRALWRRVGHLGSGGVHGYAIAALDTAMWDVRAQELGVPLSRLLGGSRTSVPAYGSGLWRWSALEDIVAEAVDWKSQGFNCIKMRVGSGAVAEEAARVAAVRAAYDGELMLEAATGWTEPQTRRYLRAMVDYDPLWIEDPVPAHDIDALARLSHDQVPVAGGEWLNGAHDLLRYLRAGCFDYVILDLQRVGGISGWLHAAHVAEAFGLPVSAHIFPEIAVHLLCGVPNAGYLEYLPWSGDLVRDPPRLADGRVHVGDEPGLGIRLNAEFIDAHVHADVTVNRDDVR